MSYSLRFQGAPKIHIRKYIENQDQENIPTRYGIALNVDEWTQLTQMMAKLNEITEAMTEALSSRKGNNELKQDTVNPSTKLITRAQANGPEHES